MPTFCKSYLQALRAGVDLKRADARYNACCITVWHYNHMYCIPMWYMYVTTGPPEAVLCWSGLVRHEGARSGPLVLGGSGGTHPQKNFGFQPLLERFWWVLVVFSSRLWMECNLRVNMSVWLGADSPQLCTTSWTRSRDETLLPARQESKICPWGQRHFMLLRTI